MDSRLSVPLIKPFIRKNGIDMRDFVKERYPSFNRFFTRRLRAGARTIDACPDALIAPCDGLVSAYPVGEDGVFHIKGTPYTVGTLTDDPALADRFRGGLALIYRLTPANYHRYCYPDDGTKGDSIKIPGVLHTVRPFALGAYPVFKTNSREYTLLRTAHGGDVIMAEVGAMLVGRIVNHATPRAFSRGEEKGFFEFGGSTVLLVYTKGAAAPDETVGKTERPVKLGERVGTIRYPEGSHDPQ